MCLSGQLGLEEGTLEYGDRKDPLTPPVISPNGK